MKPGAPWSIKGIDPEAREAAKTAAAQAGMTLGEFFNHILLESDPSEIIGGGGPSADAPSKRMSATAVEPDIMGSAHAAGDMAEIRQSISQMSEQIVALQEQKEDPSELSQKALEDINYRIEESRQQNENAIAETQNTLATISEHIEASISRSNEAMTTVGKAIEVMAGRLDTLEKKSANAAMAAPAASEPAIPEVAQDAAPAPEPAGLEEFPEDSPEDAAEEASDEALEESLTPSLADALEDYSPAKSDEWMDKIAGDDDTGHDDAGHPAESTEAEAEAEENDDASSADSNSADDSLSNFDVDAYLAEKAEQIDPGFTPAQEPEAEAPVPDMPESDVPETVDLDADDQATPEADEADESDAEDTKTEVSAMTPPSSASVDDFLNQFGDDMLAKPQGDDQIDKNDDAEEAPSESAAAPDDDAGDSAAPDDEAGGGLIEPEYEAEEPVETPGKSPQDVIEAIRRAARQSSMPEAYDADGEYISSDDKSTDTVRPAMVSKRSPGVKYAIYAACTAVLLAAGGWIASMKGLI